MSDRGDPTYPANLARQLRREILIGDLPPGSPIKERDHAARLGVSRTPLREAVRILSQEGLVILRPLRSPVVADPGLQEVLDEIVVLRQLEMFSGELACLRATEPEIDAILDLNARVAAEHATGDKLDVFDLDMQMHRNIVAAAHNPALARTHGEYLARLWRIRFISASQRTDSARVLADHAGMAQALRARDGATMMRHIRSHFDGFIRNVERHFAPDAASGPANARETAGGPGQPVKLGRA
ncbi:GntR family transcriptional regulator [Paracoccus pacificus]|uniref:GntR family transcriptional regulator n=1 Tax=Paracoccus pacificus TaxID=1463598 RepID=A0ABW4R5H1_9RHOB